MSERRALKDAPATTEAARGGGLYFANPDKKDLDLISSGCTLLDCVLGGGWPMGRMSNVIGDSSSGKTLLATEAMANFHAKYPKGLMRYFEAEAAFDEGYADALGIPVEKIEFEKGIDTAEGLFQDLIKTTERTKREKRPCFYVVDSLDALSDKKEKEESVEKKDYPRKPQILSRLFRQHIKQIESSRMHLMIVSQIRENIGVTFGEKYSVSGGMAMRFYASQRLWLREVEKVEKQSHGHKRITALIIAARCRKNKIGLAHRECEFPLLFGYGVDDVAAGLEFLEKVEDFKWEELGEFAKGLPAKHKEESDGEHWKRCSTIINQRVVTARNNKGEEYRALRATTSALVKRYWMAIEEQVLPKSKKY